MAVPDLSIGIAETVVTPPVGALLEGYGNRKHTSTGVQDDLYAHALLLDDGRTRAAVLTCDLHSTDQWFTSRVRRHVEAAGILPGSHLMLVPTHSHGAPRGLVRFRESYDEVLAEATARQIAGAMIAASKDLRPAHLKYGRGQVTAVAQNRRFPDAPIDAAVDVLRVEEVPSGQLRGALVGHAVHATVMNFDNLLISADYPGQVRLTIRRLLGEIPVLYGNGCCANVNPARIAAVFAEVERLGTIVGAEAARVLAELGGVGQLVAADNSVFGERTPKEPPAHALEITTPQLGVTSEWVELPFREFAGPKVYEERIALARRELAALGISEEDTALIRAGRAGESGVGPDTLARRRALMAELTRLTTEAGVAARLSVVTDLVGTTHFRAEVQVVQLSPEVAIVGLPGEIVVEIGLALKAASGRPGCIVFGYANDYVSYVPVPAHLPEGGYEAGRTLFAPSAERLLREGALRALARLAG